MEDTMLPELTQDEVFRYARHLTIPEVGLEGQRKLKAASVLVVGTGGLGSAISLYLAAAGVGRIGLVDFDLVDSSNLQRQVIHDTEHIGKPKVESARQRMLGLNPYIRVDAFPTPFAPENAEKIAADYEMIVDGSDNLPARYLINDLCVLSGKPYIYGSVYQFEGQVSVFDASKGPCYRCVFREPPPVDAMPSGVQMGVFGALPGTIGTIQATEAIKWIVGAGESLAGRLLLYDALSMTFHSLEICKDPNCRVCGEHPEIHSLKDFPQYYQRPALVQIPDEQSIEPIELAELLQSDARVQLVDVRLPVEQKISRLEGAQLIPLSQLEERAYDLSHDTLIVLFSRDNQHAGRALQILLRLGFKNVKVLQGGINAWAREFDQGMLRY
jgi:molybdopterin/thiamine biosynthesis adenylyltransferase/rhodanese-related sulfurtransferase